MKGQTFDKSITDVDIERILSLPVFSELVLDGSPRPTVKNLFRNHARIRQHLAGDIIVREGDHGNSAFVVVKGAVRVVVNPGLSASVLGRREPAKKSLLAALAQLWRQPKYAEVQKVSQDEENQSLGTRDKDEAVVFLKNIEEILENHQTVLLKRGEMFGEIAALSRNPRTVSVFADNDVELVEIRRQGLHNIKRLSSQFQAHIDGLYRERILNSQLRMIPALQNLHQDILEKIKEQVTFKTFDENDEEISTARNSGSFPGGSVIQGMGQEMKNLILIHTGYVRLVDEEGANEKTVGHLRHGDSYGFAPILQRWKNQSNGRSLLTLKAQGPVDLILVPAAVLELYAFPVIGEKSLSRLLLEDMDNFGFERARQHSPMFEFLNDNGFIMGTSVMMIDLERCTHCDDCVRACAATHGNNPRFVRAGKTLGSYMVAHACMHCANPVCMIDCPTGAISRNALGGQITINNTTCIGCSSCANKCPFDNINMVDLCSDDGELQINDDRGVPVVKAATCDLCVDQLKGFACQDACPHDALLRLNPKDPMSLMDWMER